MKNGLKKIIEYLKQAVAQSTINPTIPPPKPDPPKED